MEHITRDKVMVFGTFDIIHKGHINFFKQAKKYGDYLIVVAARDKTVLKVKGQLPRNKEKERLNNIKKSGLVDKAVLGGLGNKYAVIKKLNPDMICLGYDQKVFTEGLKARLKILLSPPLLKGVRGRGIKIIRLKPFKPEIYKSSKIKKYET